MTNHISTCATACRKHVLYTQAFFSFLFFLLSNTALNAQTCPTIDFIDVTNIACEGLTFAIAADGINDYLAVDNGDTDFDINFVYLPEGSGADPYIDGVFIDSGTPSSGSVSIVETGDNIPIGAYDIYAILNPAPTDMNCRPFAQATINITPCEDLGDFCFIDFNNDGIYNAQDAPLPLVSISFYDAATDNLIFDLFPATSNVNGNYGFAPVPPGDYFLKYEPVAGAGYIAAASPGTGANNTNNIDPLATNGPNTTLDFHFTGLVPDYTFDAGFIGQGSISGEVWADDNFDFIHDETGTQGINLTLSWWGVNGLWGDDDDVMLPATTDVDGRYSFQYLPYGAYRLNVTSLENTVLNQGYELVQPLTTPVEIIISAVDLSFTDQNFIYQPMCLANSGNLVTSDPLILCGNVNLGIYEDQEVQVYLDDYFTPLSIPTDYEYWVLVVNEQNEIVQRHSISSPQNGDFVLVDVATMPVGDYAIHGLQFLTTDPDFLASPFDLSIGADFQNITNRLTTIDGMTNPLITADVCGATGLTQGFVQLSMDPQPPVNLACIGSINMSLNDQCSATVTPQTVLVGIWGCLIPSDFQIDIYENGQLVSNQGLISGCGTFEYRIDVMVDGINGFPCWGIINARDNTPPEVSCPADISQAGNALGLSNFLCSDISQLLFQSPVSYTVNGDGTLLSIDQSIKAILDVTGYPVVSEGCGPARVYIADQLITDGDCGETTISRVFSIEDNADGHCSTLPNAAVDCTQLIHFTKPVNGDVILPPSYVELPCNDFGGQPNPTPTQIYDALGVYGYPAVFAYHDADISTVAFDPYFLNQTYCNIGASYQDFPRIELCGNSYSFIREWFIIDDCAPGNTIVFQQIIKVKDVTNPVLVLPMVDYDGDGLYDVRRYSTSPFNCVANIVIAAPTELNDFCSGPPTVNVTVRDNENAFVFTGTIGDLFSVPIGNYSVEYCAVDDCGNETCVTMPIIVRDAIEPTVVCNDQLIVQIGGGDSQNGIQGVARIMATSLDQGSNDNCSEVNFQARRNYWEEDDCGFSLNEFSPWGDFVDFYCCDVGKDITVELKVSDAAGNENVCQFILSPEDKLKPHCTAPQNQILTCVEFPLLTTQDIEAAYNTDFTNTSIMMSQLFNHATATDNCGVDTIVERSPIIQINSCGWGSIQRRFRAWQWLGDANGNGVIDASEVLESTNTCTQTISITETHHYRIVFPEDADADCNEPIIPEIETEILGCDQLVINTSEPVFFPTNSDACYKLAITYDVIDWCLWDGESEAYVIPRMTGDSNSSVDECEQPVVESTDIETTIDRYHPELDMECDSIIPSIITVAAAQNVHRWSYTQFIKVYDNTVPEIIVDTYGGPTAQCPDLAPTVFGSLDNENCDALVHIPFSLTDDCEIFNDQGELALEITGAWVDFLAVDTNSSGSIEAPEFVADQDVLTSVTYQGETNFVFEMQAPLIYREQLNNSYHTLFVTIRDACGNASSIYIPFQVIDCKAPAPTCNATLSVTVQPTMDGPCSATIWASDIIASSIDDCSGIAGYAIYFTDSVGADFVPNPQDTGLVVIWNEQEYVEANVYAIDGQGNFDHCTAGVQIQASLSCTALGALGGMIQTEGNLGVSNVQLSINGPVPMTTMSELNGAFLFEDLEEDYDYTITANRSDDHGNGVTTLDIIKINKHILGVELLDSPYKRIAADANRSGSITTLDVIHIRKVILTIYEEFPNNTSWRFVNSAYEFPPDNNPWFEFFPELISINNLVGQELELGFTAIKVGDINGSATP